MGKRHRRPADPRYTLTQLEDHDWGAPTHDSSIARRLHALRNKPIGEFGVEDLRFAIGQEMSLAILLPLALDELERDPLVSGHHYEGDLLQMVLLCVDKWPRDRETLERLRLVLQRSIEDIPGCPHLIDKLKAELLAQCRLGLEHLT